MIRNAIFRVFFGLFSLIVSTACSNSLKTRSSQPASAIVSTPNATYDAKSGNGQIALTIPPLDSSLGANPDRVIISLSNSTAQNLQKVDGPFAPRASYTLLAPVGSCTVKVDVYGSDRLLLSGSTTVTVTAGNNVVANISLASPDTTGQITVTTTIASPVPVPVPLPVPVHVPIPAPVHDKQFLPAPCGSGDPVNRACDVGDETVDAPIFEKTCLEQGIKPGDLCTGTPSSCIQKPGTACKSAPQTPISGPYRLICTVNDDNYKRAGSMCPVSKREFKRNIAALTAQSQSDLAASILNLKIARYEYKPGLGLDSAPQLGFVIDDYKDLPFLTNDRGHVNLYGYISALVATIQAQELRIQSLEKAVDQP